MGSTSSAGCSAVATVADHTPAKGPRAVSSPTTVCNTLHREGAGTCQARYLNAARVEEFVVQKIKERIFTGETITELVTLVAEEVDAMAGEFAGRLKVIQAELADVESRLERLSDALETSAYTGISPRILSLRHRQDQLTTARDEAESQPEQRRVELPGDRGDQGVRGRFSLLP